MTFLFLESSKILEGTHKTCKIHTWSSFLVKQVSMIIIWCKENCIIHANRIILIQNLWCLVLVFFHGVTKARLLCPSHIPFCKHLEKFQAMLQVWWQFSGDAVPQHKAKFTNPRTSKEKEEIKETNYHL